MPDLKTEAKRDTTELEGGAVHPAEQPAPDTAKRRLRVIPFLITLVVVAIAASLGWAMWKAYMGTPWTRDGTVRVYVVTMAAEISGRIVELPVNDNQFVHKGDLLMVIEPDQLQDRRRPRRGGRAAGGCQCAERGQGSQAPRAIEHAGSHGGGAAELCGQRDRPPRPSISRPWPIWSRRR